MPYKPFMYPQYFIEKLKIHEGYRGKMYKCSAGVWTVGYGHNLESNTISTSAAGYILKEDIAKTDRELKKRCPIYRDIWGPRRYALLDMAFNMGVGRLLGFVKMWKAIAKGDWNEAAHQAWDSKWRREDVSEERSSYIIETLRTGEIPQS